MAIRRQIGLYDSREEATGGGLGLLTSILVHVALITTVLLNAPVEKAAPENALTYVELAQSLPQFAPDRQSVIEAPGPEVPEAPRDAPLSDANRRASTPQNAETRADRPGLVDAPFIPGSPGQAAASQPQDQSQTDAREDTAEREQSSDRLRFEQSRSSSLEKPTPTVDWSSAIQQAGKIASLGGDLGTFGGDEGFAESGPISFETQWFQWGEYATGMIRKIRYHWYNNMPALVRMGMKGVVVIRFTIQRDGTITDITILQSSTHPPFDFAARKAIELSSPLQPLPADFPKASERVTAAFYYNVRPPRD